jgi:uncharacterized protein YecT (DUF1311 family)
LSTNGKATAENGAAASTRTPAVVLPVRAHVSAVAGYVYVMSHRAVIGGALAILTVGALAEDCSTPGGAAICAVESQARAERELGAVYVRVIRKATAVVDASGHRQNLGPRISHAQSRWLAYRKSVCELERQATLLGNPSRGGPAGQAEIACLQRFAENRAKELESFAEEFLR